MMHKFSRFFIAAVVLLFSGTTLYADHSNEEAFTTVYQTKYWGTNIEGEGSSGSGSTEESTRVYRAFLQDFFKIFDIHSVVDFGCGDWEFSKLISWDGINYVGFDVVKSVVGKNQQKFAQQNIQFNHADGLLTDLPEADLLICKDVLQHLPNEDVALFFNQIGKFKYCLITNDVHPHTQTSDNPNIKRGDYRLLDLTKPPFNIEGIKIFTYFQGPNLKQVLLIKKKVS